MSAIASLSKSEPLEIRDFRRPVNPRKLASNHRITLTAPNPSTLGVTLLNDGLIAPHLLLHALALQRRHGGRLCDILLSHQMIDEQTLFEAQARHWSARIIDPDLRKPDPRLVDRLGAGVCLLEGLLPWRKVGQATIIATASPETFARHSKMLRALFGPVAMALAPAAKIEQTVLALRGSGLVEAAETRVPEAESCRKWGRNGFGAPLAVLAMALAAGLWLAPMAVGLVFVVWAALTLGFITLLRSAALIAALGRKPDEREPPLIARMPVVSIMVALFNEGDIAARLIRRLDRLDYPRDLLDIVLVTEQSDTITRAALGVVELPAWMRIVVVPDGTVKTKPRALNFGLEMCRGSIIGVYDAEDAPESDQIRKVVNRFYQVGAEVACLQGVLDFYNPRTNWLSRCFTIEYAAWFRVILPGLQRLGLPVPLGGTTLFFRRAALEDLGGWDAHNVTEDADLGIRLARHGYRTELLDTVTEEEANCRALPWVRQRSRWLKGYMMTWAVHMRDPALLWRQLGAWKFAGFQVLFLCTLSQFVLAPVLWSFWLVAFGLAHPLAAWFPPAAMLGLLGLYLITDVVNLLINVIALRMTKHRLSLFWVPSLHFYFPLGSLASYKAAWELVARPFYWDKTSHGHFDPPELAPDRPAKCDPVDHIDLATRLRAQA